MAITDVRILITAVDNATKVLDSIAGKAAVIGLGMERTGQSLASVGRGMVGVADPLKGAIQSAMNLESEMADVNKVLGAQEVAAAGVGKGLMEMSRRIPTSVQGLAAISAAGGSLGIPAKEILAFTETTAKMGIAFGMSADQAGEAIAKMRNVFSLDTKGGVREVTALGDSINELSNNMAARAPYIVEAMTRIGGTTRTFGLSADQSAALAASIISLGNAPDVAATAINSILPSLQTATGGTDRFKRGLASVGISAEEMEGKVKANAMGAIQDLLKSLERLDPQVRALAIKDMFGSGADARALGTLANDASALSKALGLVNDSTKVAGSMQREFASRSATTANSIQLLQNNLTEIAVNVGSVLLPALESVTRAIMPVVQGFASFAQANPQLTKVAAAALIVVASLGAVIVGLGTLISFVGSAIAGFGTLAAAWTGATAAIGAGMAWVASVGGLGAIVASVGAIITTAFGAAAAAVGALGLPFLAVAAVVAGAAFLIVRHWKPISAFFVNLFKNPIGTLKDAATTIGGLFTTLPAQISSVWRKVASGIGTALVPVGAAIGAVFARSSSNIIAPYKFAFDFLVGLFQGLAPALAPGLAALRGMVSGASASIQGATSQITSFFGGVAASVRQTIGGAMAAVTASLTGAKAVINGVLNQIGAGFLGFVAGIKTALAPISTTIQGVFTGVLGAVSGALSNIQNLTSQFIAGLLTVISPIASGVTGMVNGIASTVTALVGGIIAKVQGVVAAFGTAQASGQSMGQAVGAALGRVIVVVTGIIARVGQIPAAFAGIGSQILASINAIASQMFTAGANMIGQLVGGIQSKIGDAVSAMSSAVGQMRDYLPFSPAKVGPLSDLDRVDFMGTVAQSITPTPITDAIQSAMNAVQGVIGSEVAMPAITQVLSAIAPTETTDGMTTEGSTGVSNGTTIPVSAQGGSLHVDASISVVINGNPATPQAQESLRSQLEAHQTTIIRIMENHQRNQRRTSYS